MAIEVADLLAVLLQADQADGLLRVLLRVQL
jgi:hypothetical protein